MRRAYYTIVILAVLLFVAADIASAKEDFIGPPTPPPDREDADTYQRADDEDNDKAVPTVGPTVAPTVERRWNPIGLLWILWY